VVGLSVHGYVPRHSTVLAEIRSSPPIRLNRIQLIVACHVVKELAWNTTVSLSTVHLNQPQLVGIVMSVSIILDLNPETKSLGIDLVSIPLVILISLKREGLIAKLRSVIVDNLHLRNSIMAQRKRAKSIRTYL
jgi:hypothetical protein